MIMETKKLFNPKRIFTIFTILGAVGLFSFYYMLLLLITKDFQHPFTQFLELQPWMSILIIGFGIQVGLYALLKRGYRLSLAQKKDAGAAAGAGGAMSGVSMVACCAHHAADIVPILGISGAALFLTEYQKELLVLGIFANTIGVLYMSWLVAGKQDPKSVLRLVFNRQEVAS